MFGRAVVGHVRVPFLARDRGDINDPTVVLLAHIGHDILQRQEGAEQIRLDDLFEFYESDIGKKSHEVAKYMASPEYQKKLKESLIEKTLQVVNELPIMDD